MGITSRRLTVKEAYLQTLATLDRRQWNAIGGHIKKVLKPFWKQGITRQAIIDIVAEAMKSDDLATKVKAAGVAWDMINEISQRQAVLYAAKLKAGNTGKMTTEEVKLAVIRPSQSEAETDAESFEARLRAMEESEDEPS